VGLGLGMGYGAAYGSKYIVVDPEFNSVSQDKRPNWLRQLRVRLGYMIYHTLLDFLLLQGTEALKFLIVRVSFPHCLDGSSSGKSSPAGPRQY